MATTKSGSKSKTSKRSASTSKKSKKSAKKTTPKKTRVAKTAAKKLKSKKATRAVPTLTQKAGNSSNVYAIPGGYYVNWQLGNYIHRRAFTASKYMGSMTIARGAAEAEVAYLNGQKEAIGKALAKSSGKGEGKLLAAAAAPKIRKRVSKRAKAILAGERNRTKLASAAPKSEILAAEIEREQEQV